MATRWIAVLLSLLGLVTDATDEVSEPVPTATYYPHTLSHPDLPNAHWVDSHVMRGAQPGDGGWKALASQGVRTVLSLRPWVSDQTDVEATGMRYVRVPLQSWIPSASDVGGAVEVLAKSEDGPFFVYDRRGSDHVGLVVAAYRRAKWRWSAADAIEEMTDPRYGFDPAWRDLVDVVRRLRVPKRLLAPPKEPAASPPASTPTADPPP